MGRDGDGSVKDDCLPDGDLSIWIDDCAIFQNGEGVRLRAVFGGEGIKSCVLHKLHSTWLSDTPWND